MQCGQYTPAKLDPHLYFLATLQAKATIPAIDTNTATISKILMILVRPNQRNYSFVAESLLNGWFFQPGAGKIRC
jgi:hypothetical protein